MSPFIFLSIVAVLYLTSRPRIRRYVERDGVYLSRDWTSFVNAFFISLVVCSHCLILFETNIRDYFPERVTASGVAKFGQLMVTTFFFYSGYGIMLSLLNRKGYTRMLIYPRFFSLSIDYILAVAVYFVVHCIFTREVILGDFIGGVFSFRSLGHPTWFILMTLLIYVLTYACFLFHNGRNTNKIVILLTLLLIVTIFCVNKVKPDHWVNTLLCFPAGMLYYLYGERIEDVLKKSRVPSAIYALLFIAIGYFVYRAGFKPSIYTQNIGGILFAIGTTWFYGSFQWRKPSQFLIWLGGSGLFSVYIFHLLPMRVITHLGLNNENPYLIYLSVAVATFLLVYIFNIVYKKINSLLFSSQ